MNYGKLWGVLLVTGLLSAGNVSADTDTKVLPSYSNGIINGFRFSQVDPASQWAKVGIQNDDVVLSVNGTKPDSAQSMWGMVSSMKTATHIDLMIQRSGKTQPLSYDQ